MTVRGPIVLALALACLVSHPEAGQAPSALDWTLSDGPYVGAVSDLTLSPSGVLFAATTDGLLRSDDDGAMWTRCDTPDPGRGGARLVRRAPDGQLFVALSDQDMLRYADERCRTSFQVVLPDDFNSPRSVSALAISPSGRLLASRFGFGLFWSDDRGATWRRSNIAPNDWVNSIHHLDTRVIATSANGKTFESRDGGEVWATIAQSGSPHAITAGSGQSLLGAGAGVVGSTAAGREWQPLGLDDRLVWTVTFGQRLTASEPDRTRLFAAVHVPDRSDNALFRSRDDGGTWTPLPAGVRGRVYALAYTPHGTLLAGTEHGLYRSTDDGDTWAFTGVAPAQLSSIATFSDGAIVAHGAGEGMWRSDDGARTWRRLDTDRLGPLLFLRSGRLLASGALSDDRGSTWQRSGLVAFPTRALLQLDDGTLLAGTDSGVFRSTDGAARWIEHSTGLVRFDIRTLAARGDGVVFLATGEDVYRSNDGGQSWRPLRSRTTQTPASVAQLALDSDGRLVAAAARGVFEYVEETREWQPAAETSSPVQALVADGEGRIWVGTGNDGVLLLRRAQGAWAQAPAGLPGLAITALAVDRAGRLIASTGRGTYWAPLPGRR